MQSTGMSGGADFSAYGIKKRFNIGYQPVKGYFDGQTSRTKTLHRTMTSNVATS